MLLRPEFCKSLFWCIGLSFNSLDVLNNLQLYWELYSHFSFQLSEHFHPSVALFAKTILQGNYIQYSGDPLQDFTLMRFLDRFVYRNPKPHKGKENTHSIVMQPKRKHFMRDIRSFAGKYGNWTVKSETYKLCYFCSPISE